MRAAIFIVLGLLSNAAPATGAALQVEARIPLPDCKGRIDHLAFDAAGKRLFVAELGNGTVAVLDLEKRRLVRRLTGLDEPQGIAYDASSRRLYVAEGGSGIVRSYDDALEPIHQIKLSGDADNIRIDPAAPRVYVGHGDGALAILDAASLARVGEIPLKGHPESFQLSSDDARIYVNVPGARQIAVLDRATQRPSADWSMTWRANYPMTLDDDAVVLVVFREPARIARFVKGQVTADAEVCGDADDVFIDRRRDRVYVICGQGVVDVLERNTLRRLERVPTAPGARTGLYSAEADRLFVAVRAGGGQQAEIRVFEPN